VAYASLPGIIMSTQPATGRRTTVIVWLVTLAALAAILYFVWTWIDRNIGSEEGPASKPPPISENEILQFPIGTPKEEILLAVGKGQTDTTQRGHDLCWIYSIEGGQPNSYGAIPVVELCFDRGQLSEKSRGRY
jgi:hypothetical protein